MSLRLGDTAPDFTAETSLGTVNFYDYLGDSWGVLFSHPADFTPVCTTELGRTAALREEFVKRNVKPIAISVDGVESHNNWITDINEAQDVSVQFPIIADEDRSVSLSYDMIHPQADDTFTVRSVYFIDPNKKIRLILTYPAQVGRNFDEIIRIIDALQKVDSTSVATPVNWQPGQPTIIPASIKDSSLLVEKYGDSKEIFPYLRFTKK